MKKNEILPVATIWIVLKGHWRESKQVLFLMISVLRTVWSSAHSCFPGTDKEQRVLEKWHTKEENNILDPLKLNVPWQMLTLFIQSFNKYLLNSSDV